MVTLFCSTLKSKLADVSLKTFGISAEPKAQSSEGRNEGDKPTGLYNRFSVRETAAAAGVDPQAGPAHLWLTSQDSKQVTKVSRSKCHHGHTAVHLLLQQPGEQGSHFLCFGFPSLPTSLSSSFVYGHRGSALCSGGYSQACGCQAKSSVTAITAWQGTAHTVDEKSDCPGMS